MILFFIASVLCCLASLPLFLLPTGDNPLYGITLLIAGAGLMSIYCNHVNKEALGNQNKGPYRRGKIRYEFRGRMENGSMIMEEV